MDHIKKIINDSWKFCLKDEKLAFQKDFPDDSWEGVTLPHDWSVQYPLSREYSSGTGYVIGGTAWYRKHLMLPEEWKDKKIFVLFDGVYKNSQVWINGYYLGKRPYGYSSFQYDISEFLCFGQVENVISVKVTHEDLADSRWYTGSGIYRKVSLLAYDDIYPIENGVFYNLGNVSEEGSEIIVTCELSSSKDYMDVKIINQLIDADGKPVLTMEARSDIKSSGVNTIVSKDFVKTPVLWSTENPYLYTLETSVTNPVTGVSNVISKIEAGIRCFSFDANKGFFLNGKPESFKGVCLHHDGGCLGAAMTKEVWRRRLIKLKAMGCNSIRMSHNPHMPELYELCDEMGFLAIDEAFDEWEAPKNKWHIGHNVYPPKLEGYAEDFPQWHEQDLTAMIKRDRNHPSIVMWSIGNEIDYPNDPYVHPLFNTMTGNNDKDKPAEERLYNPAKPNAERLSKIAAKLIKIIKKTDSSRPVTAAVAFPELSTQIGYIDDLDVVGYNYKEHLYEDDHKRFPEKPFLGSENGHSFEAWKAVTDNEYISGQFLWTGIDYLGECKGWPIHGSFAGELTTAGFEKHSYYKRQSWWSDEAVVHIVTARKDTIEDKKRYEGWYTPEYKEMYESWNYVPGEAIEVRCYTNQPDVKLYLNGKECRDRFDTSDMGYTTWFVDYEGGTLEAVADKASHKLETVSAPVKIKLVPFNLESKTEEGQILQIELFVQDEKDRLVVSDHSKITVNLEGSGTLLGLDNGDLSDVTDYTANYRSTKDGKLIIYVRKTGEGNLKVVAENPYLKTAEILL